MKKIIYQIVIFTTLYCSSLTADIEGFRLGELTGCHITSLGVNNQNDSTLELRDLDCEGEVASIYSKDIVGHIHLGFVDPGASKAFIITIGNALDEKLIFRLKNDGFAKVSLGPIGCGYNWHYKIVNNGVRKIIATNFRAKVNLEIMLNLYKEDDETTQIAIIAYNYDRSIKINKI